MLVFIAVSMVGMLGMLALTIDVGAGNRQRRIAQTAADAAAIFGAQDILRHTDSAGVWAAAMDGATLNHFGSEALVFYPPSSDAGALAGNLDYVEVKIAKTVPTLFGFILNKPTLDVKARAVAGAAAFSQYCVIALDTTGSAINMPNGSELDASNCAVGANSDIVAHTLFAQTIGSTGDVNVQLPGGAIIKEGLAPVVDPFAHLAVPEEEVDECDAHPATVVVNVDMAVDQGTYCGGFRIEANRRLTLNPGTYIIRGGGIDGLANGAELYGDGVTIIVSNGPGNDVSAFEPIRFGNTCYHTLKAPTAGDYKGIVVFGDPAGPTTGTNSIHKFCGKGLEAGPDIRGTIYLPTQTFELTKANGKLVIAGTVVAKVVTAENGGGKYTIQSDASGNSGFKRISLVQ